MLAIQALPTVALHASMSCSEHHNAGPLNGNKATTPWCHIPNV